MGPREEIRRPAGSLCCAPCGEESSDQSAAPGVFKSKGTCAGEQRHGPPLTELAPRPRHRKQGGEGRRVSRAGHGEVVGPLEILQCGTCSAAHHPINCAWRIVTPVSEIKLS